MGRKKNKQSKTEPMEPMEPITTKRLSGGATNVDETIISMPQMDEDDEFDETDIFPPSPSPIQKPHGATPLRSLSNTSLRSEGLRSRSSQAEALSPCPLGSSPAPSTDPNFRSSLKASAKFRNALTRKKLRSLRLRRGISVSRKQSLSPVSRSESANLAESANTLAINRKLLNNLCYESDELSIAERKVEYQKLKNELKDTKIALSCIHYLYANWNHMLGRFWGKIYSVWRYSGLWTSGIDELQGVHGAHVGVYFSKMKFILMLNLLLSALWVGLVILPQLLVFDFDDTRRVVVGGDPNFRDDTGTTFVGLITGGGQINTSFYFYGAYTQHGILTASVGSVWDNSGNGRDVRLDEYDMTLAYFSVTVITFALSYLSIFHEIHQAAKDGVKSKKSVRGEWIPQAVLTGYDYSLTNKDSIFSSMATFRSELVEYAAMAQALDISLSEKILRRGLIWLIVLASLGGTLYGIFFTVTRFSDSSDGIEKLYPAIVLTAANGIIPWVFEILAGFEKYSNQNYVIQLTLMRSVVLRFVALLVFFFTIIDVKDGFQCWENYVGQQIYAAFVVEFLSQIVTCGIFDMNVTLIHKYLKICHPFAIYVDMVLYYGIFPVVMDSVLCGSYKQLIPEPAYFDTIGKCLTLLYSQCMIWLGATFCPILPILGVIRNFILFYVQKWSTMRWCYPRTSVKQFDSQVSLPNVIWYLLLCGVIISSAAVGYMVPRYAMSGRRMTVRWHDAFVGHHLTQDLSLLDANRTFDELVCPLQEDGVPVVSSCDICGDNVQLENRTLVLTNANVTTDASQSVCWYSAWEDESGNSNFFFNTSRVAGGALSEGVFLTLEQLCSSCPLGCGPFRSHENAYDVLIVSSKSWDTEFLDVVAFLGTPTFTVILAVGLLSWILIVKAQANAKDAFSHKLSYQLDIELHDKNHLVSILKEKGIIEDPLTQNQREQ